MSTLDKINSTKLENGLNRDFNYQKPGDATFVLNGIRNSVEGGFAEYQSEPGNENYYSLPAGYKIVGSIYGTDNRVYLFSTNGIRSEIGVQRNNNYNTLVNAVLNFNVQYPITGEFRVRNHCNNTIYWCDHLNSDRWFDEDNPDLFKDGAGNWVPDKFNFNPEIKVPQVNLQSVNDYGGNLKIGSYYFQIELLDENENLIYKTDITPQTIIYDDSINSDYINIDGAVNISQFDAIAGGVPETNKSITLSFSNLDLNYSYLRVKVAYQTTANQILQAHQVGALIPIGATTLSWTYTGYNPNNGDFEIDYSEFLVDNIRYDSSYVMEQVQNRLVRANLKKDVKNYSSYQAAASNIITKWVASESLSEDQTSLGNPKNPLTYWYKTSFMGDEVYALGIQYLHSNGEWSPVFHIPGREATNFDTDFLLVVSDGSTLGTNEVWLSDVKHIPQTEFQFWNSGYLGSTISRWKVFNTASITTSQTTTHPYNYKGEFSYYEANYTYPDIKDCDNNLIWGDDITTDTKVRFHKFPDRRLIPHLSGSEGEYIVPFGIEFSLVSYPDSTIVGHRFCHAIRNIGNQTVTDSGWSYEVDVNEIDNTMLINGAYQSTDSKYSIYLSPEVVYNNSLTDTNYLKYNKVYRIDTNVIDDIGGTTAFTSVNNNTINNAIIYTNNIQSQTPLRTNYKTEKQIFIDAGKKVDETVLGFEIKNDDYLTPVSVIETTDVIEDHSSLNGGESGGTLLFPPGELFINGNTSYVYKKVSVNPYSNLLGLNYSYINFNPTNNTTSTWYGGDTTLNNNTMFRLIGYTIYKFNEDTVDNLFEYVYIDKMWCETNLSSSLRYGSFDDAFNYFRRGSTDLQAIKHFTNVLEQAPGSPTFKLEFRTQDEWYSEPYNYNKDLDLQKQQKIKLPLPITYDYCSNCTGLFRNRIVFSPKSFDEENFDLYRTTFTNDYIDVPAHRGEITGLQYKNNYLIVRTTETTFILRPNPQSIATNESNIYLATGDFLGLPPEEIAQSDVGFAGMQSKLSEVNTPYGLFWTDQKRGQVFKFDNQLEELSSAAYGLNQWFKENLPSQLDNQFLQLYNVHYPFLNSTINDKSIGVLMFYDPRYKRVFIYKKDYLTKLLGVTYNYSFSTNGFYSADGTVRQWIDTVFENRSFTVSFSIDYNTWTSWHSYLPYYAFNDENHYYTLDENFSRIHKPYKHLHNNSYQTYYGTKKPFVIEHMVFDYNTDNLNALYYSAYCLKYDPDSRTHVVQNNKTFNKMMCYNSNQNTGLVDLILQNQHTNPYINVNQLPNIKMVINTDNNYKISGIYDMSINRPVITSNWDLIKSNYYMDIIPFNIDFTKPQYNWSKLKDKYCFVRLYYYPDTEDVKQVINLIQTQESYSVR